MAGCMGGQFCMSAEKEVGKGEYVLLLLIAFVDAALNQVTM
jgi:hypothetical protein